MSHQVGAQEHINHFFSLNLCFFAYKIFNCHNTMGARAPIVIALASPLSLSDGDLSP